MMPNYWTCGHCGASVEVSDKHCGNCSRRNDFPEKADRSKLPTSEGPDSSGWNDSSSNDSGSGDDWGTTSGFPNGY